MNITPQELQGLLGLLGITAAQEINCEEFLSLTPGYLEKLKEHEGPLIEGYQSFLHHLQICPECTEEFEALHTALRDGLL